MLLNYEEILTSQALKNFEQKNFRIASYDLRIEKIVDMKGNEISNMRLAPQGMATLIFKEEVNLPPDILAYAHVKTSLTRIGVMAINIGIVDPGYNGELSTVIINYGNEPHELKAGQSCLRLTFHRMNKPNQLLPLPTHSTKETYANQRIVETLKYLGNSFLNLDLVEKEVHNKVWEMIWKRLAVISIVIAALALAINTGFNLLNRSDKYRDEEIKRYNIQTQDVKEQYKGLEERIKKLEKVP